MNKDDKAERAVSCCPLRTRNSRTWHDDADIHRHLLV